MPTPRTRPPWLSLHVVNPLAVAAARLGVGVNGLRLLVVSGQRSGRPREVPLTPVEVAGATFLVAPRGDTAWARNLRAAGRGELRLGRRREGFTAVELDDDDKPPVLRAYLQRHGRATGRFFEGIDAGADDAAFRRAASRHPVFRVQRW